MLPYLLQRFKQLFIDLAADGLAEDTPDPAPVSTLSISGEHQEALTTLSRLREMIPVLAMFTPSQTGMAMRAEEVAAWDMLNQHFFSREAMKMSGELDGFLSLGISEELEMRWRAAYAANLLAGYETAPEGLDIVLSIVAEYHDLELMKEVLTVLDDAISEEHMAGDALIDSIGKCLVAVDSDVFDDRDAEDMHAELMELLSRAEYHLDTYDTGTRWREMMESLRSETL